MKRLFLNLFLSVAALALLDGCGGNAPVAKYDQPAPQTTLNVTKEPKHPEPARRDYPPPSYSGIFPKPPGLEPAVEFWRKTYAEWGRSQIAYHDNRYMDVVYEVMDLPGHVGEGLTGEQKNIMDTRRDYWISRVADLENKVRYNAPLSPFDRQLIARLESTGRPVGSILPGASERVRGQRGTRERFKRGLEISGNYDRQFRAIFRRAGLPEELAYLPHVESSFQPAARSSAGAVGMWQFTKGAAQSFMPGGNKVDRRMDPYASAAGAARYLSHAYNILGNWPAALTSYNHGIGGMKRAQRLMGPDFMRIVKHYAGPAFGFASRNYYAQFLAAREIANNPQLFFPEGVSYLPAANSGGYFAGDYAR